MAVDYTRVLRNLETAAIGCSDRRHFRTKNSKRAGLYSAANHRDPQSFVKSSLSNDTL